MKNKKKSWRICSILYSYNTPIVIILYSITWLFLFLSGEGKENSILYFMGGIEVLEKTAGLPLMKFFCWIFSISVPIIYLSNQFQNEIDRRIWLEFPRFSSLREWWFVNCIAMWCNCIVYVLIGILEWWLIYGLCRTDYLLQICIVLLILPKYLLITSLLAIAFLLVNWSKKGGIIMTVAIGITIVFGINSENPYYWILGSLGMVVQFWNGKSVQLFINIVILICSVFFVMLYEEKYVRKYIEKG